MSNLRTELYRLTTPPPNADIEWLDNQIKEVSRLHSTHPHSIVLITPSSDATAELNCFMYALDLQVDAVRYMCFGPIFPGAKFVSFLLNTTLKSKEILSSEAVDGDIIIYFDATGAPTHAGKYVDGKVISKWGSGRTLVWEHYIFEVPENYGNQIKFFKPLKQEKVIREFIEWASNTDF